ncbi:MAG: hypothetical protein EOP51_18495 [Sphingobacteriales bacterium]|nr:MAG: hypothetical protein EOP51_18495 [Sphingobacteriales bacterium]
MPATVPKIRFDKSGYYFIGLMALTILGFWNSYFSRFVNGTNDYSFYFHFHAVLMSIWVVILIVQPILIRKKKLPVHRIIGKISYVIMPLLLLSVILILNKGLKAVPVQEIAFANVIFPVRDFILLTLAFSIGTWYRKDINIHARAMIASGILFVEPTLARFLGGMVFHNQVGGLLTMALVCALFITLIIIERKQKSGRWIFPSMLAIFVMVYILLLLQVQFPVLDGAVRWFAKLPLT